MLRIRLLPLALILAIGGCAPLARANESYYSALKDELPAANWKGLQGRRIVLDAGHGGSEPGAVGPGGLKEKDVNLAVTQELARLLRQAGAEVLLTRDSDKDLSLVDRVAFANEKDPDLFLSIHHNATLEPKNRLDETQTYYKMEDPGPSYEIGLAIHRRLTRNLGMPRERLAPGNYFLLRYSKAPAILGEASYITHADVERKLGSRAAIALEAQSYFLGIGEYFQKGLPRVKGFAKQVGSDPARPVIVAELDGGGAPVSAASVVMTLDGERVSASYDPTAGTVVYQPPEPLTNTGHLVTLAFRNTRGNSSALSQATVTVDLPADRGVVTYPLGSPPQGGRLPLIARFEDANGHPVSDGTTVSWTTTAGQLVRPETVTRGGKAVNYLENLVPGASKTLSVTAVAGMASASVTVPTAPAPALMGYVTSKGGQVLPGTLVVAVGRDRRVTALSNDDGYFWFPDAPTPLVELKVERPGYKPLVYALRDKAFVDLQLEPFHGGAFHEQTIVLNPAGGGDERGPVSDRALQTSWLNWQVADALREYLEAAGARVVLTRQRQDMVSDIQRVRLSNQANATLFLTIAHNAEGEDDLRTEHYPSSAKGKQISESLREALARSLGSEGRVRPYSSYVLIHPACPSITVVPGPLARYDTGHQLAQARQAAYAIFLGLQPKKEAASRLKITLRYRSGAAVPNGTATLDQVTTGLTDHEGRWAFGNLDPGQHYLTVSDGTHTRSLWVVGLTKDEEREIEVVLDHPELPDNAG